jgi:hypothetical protein
MRNFLSEVADSATNRGWRFATVATKGTPVRAFRIALQSHRDAWNVLLLDREDAREAEIRTQALDGCDAGSVFWMVEIMESWFLADLAALKRHYDGGFQESALRGDPNVERIPKADVLERLKRATRATKAG